MNLASASLPVLISEEDSNGALDTEWSILLAAASVSPAGQKQEKIRLLLQRPIRWEQLLAMAEYHGVEPILNQALAPLAAHLPTEQAQLLHQRQKSSLHKVLLLSRELILLMDHLSGSDIEGMPYKGLALAQLVYGDIALRHAGDIDILVRAEDFVRAQNAIAELGYVPHDHFSEAQQRAQLKFGYECSFDGEAGPNLVELQWAIQPRFYSIDFDMRAIFQRAILVSVAGQTMKTPSLEDLVLILSAHAAKHVWARLIWLCDIARILQREDLDWMWVLDQARTLGMLRIMQVTVLLANKLLGASVPERVGALSFDDPAACSLAEQCRTFLTNKSDFNVESIAYFRLMMQLRERQLDRLRLLTRLTFTPGSGEWKVVSLPQPLFPLYWCIRLGRLAARLVRS